MASEQDIFFKTPKQIKLDAKDTLKGTYGKCIKANFLGLAVLLGVALAFTLSLLLLGDYEWIQITLCVILGALFVFFMGTVIVGNCMFYTKLHKDDAKVKDAFTSFNNIWKYGRMFIYYVLICLALFIVFAGILFLILIILNNNLFTMFQDGDIKTFGEFLTRCAKTESFIAIIILTAIFGVIAYVWAIFKSIKHATLFVSVADFPKQTLIGAYKTSKKAIKGNRLRFVKLWFSLFPHYLLCSITGGIYLIWFWPYYQTCKVVFYQDLIAEF